MELDIDNKIFLEDLAKDIKPSDMRDIAKEISNNYLSSERKNHSFIYNKDFALTYAVMRFPATFSAICTAFSHIFEIYQNKITTVLDVGSGMGTSALALKSFSLNKDYEFTLLERDINMIDIGKKILTHNNIKFQYLKCDIKEYDIKQDFDLIIFSYSFNEFNKFDQENLIKKYLPFAKLLIIVDPGTPECYESLMNVKQLISPKYNIVAPCIYKNGCPLKNDWCHFVTRLSRSSLHRYIKDADAPYEDEKFTYLAISKNKVEINKNRILRHPVIKGNSVYLSLCCENGIVNKEIYKKDKLNYKIAKKAKSGNLI